VIERSGLASRPLPESELKEKNARVYQRILWQRP
jgi:hypothetical protein